MYKDSLYKAVEQAEKVCFPCMFLKNSSGSTGGIRWYGVSGLEAKDDPALTRIGNMGHHIDLPVHNEMKGCLLLDNGTVNYYLDPDDWTKKTDGTASNLDGTDGQVMVEIPTHYYRDWIEDGVQSSAVSLWPQDNFTKLNKMYISAYEATIYRPTNKLSSVQNLTADYRGGDNDATKDLLPQSYLGKPASNIPIQQWGGGVDDWRTYAQNRGVKWHPHTWIGRTTLIRLFITEYATKQSQEAVNNTLTAKGYKQGGLGIGATQIDQPQYWTFNEYKPVIPCGTSDSLGNSSGEVYYEIPFPIPDSVPIARYRGIENIFGSMWKLLDGVAIYCNQITGNIEVWLFDNPVDYTSSNTTNGRLAGYMIGKTYGIVKEVSLGDFVITDLDTDIDYNDGSDWEKNFCDTQWRSWADAPAFGDFNQYRSYGYPINFNSVRHEAGIFCGKCDDYYGLAYNYLGTRLDYIP